MEVFLEGENDLDNIKVVGVALRSPKGAQRSGYQRAPLPAPQRTILRTFATVAARWGVDGERTTELLALGGPS